MAKSLVQRIKANFNKLQKDEVKEHISIISPSQINKTKNLFVAICNNLPKIGSFIKSSSSIAFITNGEYFTASKEILSVSNLSVLGLQEFLTDEKLIQHLNSIYFKTHHLGEIRDHFELCEVEFRDSEYIFLDIRSIKHSDFNTNEQPNGFSSEEICQIAHYIGCSLSLKGVIIYGIDEDIDNSCCNLISQIAWIISNSQIHNTFEDPYDALKKGKKSLGFQHKIVPIGDSDDSILFLYSLQSGRWWLEIPIVKKNKVVLVPCSERDFEEAKEGVLSNEWLFNYSKYNTL